MVTAIFMVVGIFEPTGFIIKVDANRDAVYILKYNNAVITPGKEVEVLFLKDTVIELTFIYLDGTEEVVKQVKIDIHVGYTASYTIRLRAYPARIRT